MLAKVKQWERKITTILLLPWLVLYCLMRRLVVQLLQRNAKFRYRQNKAFQKQSIYLTNSCNLYFFFFSSCSVLSSATKLCNWRQPSLYTLNTIFVKNYHVKENVKLKNWKTQLKCYWKNKNKIKKEKGKKGKGRR